MIEQRIGSPRNDFPEAETIMDMRIVIIASVRSKQKRIEMIIRMQPSLMIPSTPQLFWESLLKDAFATQMAGHFQPLREFASHHLYKLLTRAGNTMSVAFSLVFYHAMDVRDIFDAAGLMSSP